MKFPNTLRALNSRNYRLFFTAEVISMTGLWMHRIAMGWLVFRLTNSNSALGIMDFAASLPICLVSPFAGAVIEHIDLRRVLIFLQSCCVVLAFTLAAFTITGFVVFKILVAVAVLRGLIDAFDLPSRYSLVSYMVDRREDVSNAVALNSTVFNSARMIGPTVGGFVIKSFGEGFCFVSNGLCYIATICALRAMKMKAPPIGSKSSKSNPLRETLEGLRIARDFAPYRYFLILIMITGFFAFPSIVLMPAMAKSVLHGDPGTLGLLLMGVAMGALTGSLIMASLTDISKCSWWCTRTCAAFGAAVAIFSFSRSAAVGLVLAAPVGFCMTCCCISCNTLLQSMTPAASRSRIMALYTLAIIGIPPFGSLSAGKLGDWLGTSYSLLICGILCTINALYFLRKIDRVQNLIVDALRREEE
ncbi:MAG: MFS transporter [Synergistes sp.]|nr:MFS transporter [Synergistes sp.]